MSGYSGAIEEGWQPQGSYARLRYSGHAVPAPCSGMIGCVEELEARVQDGLTRFQASSELTSRLDMRIRVSLLRSELGGLFKRLDQIPNLEVGVIYDTERSIVREITVALNKPVRALTDQARVRVKKVIDDAINKHQEFHSDDLIERLKVAQSKGFRFVRHDSTTSEPNVSFKTEELLALWENNFGWDEESVKQLLNDPGQSAIFGIRDQHGKLVAAMLMSHQGHLIESTEWAVAESARGEGLAQLLGALSNCYVSARYSGIPIYAHLRIDRSIGVALQSGMTLNYNSIGTILVGVLGNHVTVSTDKAPDTWNNVDQLNLITGLPFATTLRTFVVGQFDPSKIPDTIKRRLRNVLESC